MNKLKFRKFTLCNHADAGFVENFTVSDRDMLKYIIGTIGAMDTPMPASNMTSYSFSAYMSRVSDEELRRDRRQVMEADQDAIRSLAPIVRKVVDAGHLVVIGNQDQIRRHADMFDRIVPLIAEADGGVKQSDNA